LTIQTDELFSMEKVIFLFDIIYEQSPRQGRIQGRVLGVKPPFLNFFSIC